MSAFTDGPWQSKHLMDRDGECTVIGGIDGPDDGRMHYTTICEVDAEHQVYVANLALIIAAPDLFKALSELHDAADEALSFLDAKRERGDFDHWQSFSLGDLGGAIHTAREALAKAAPVTAASADTPHTEQSKDYTK